MSIFYGVHVCLRPEAPSLTLQWSAYLLTTITAIAAYQSQRSRGPITCPAIRSFRLASSIMKFERVMPMLENASQTGGAE